MNAATAEEQPAPQTARRLMKALDHPMRTRILMRLQRGASSPVMLSQELEEKLGSVSYHVRVLHEHGFIELERSIQRRGALEHIYRLVTPSLLTDEEWEQVGGRLQDHTREVLDALWADSGCAVADGSLDQRLDRAVSFTHLKLDEQAWKQLGAELERVREMAADLHRACAEAGVTASSAAAIPTSMGFLLYAGSPSEPERDAA